MEYKELISIFRLWSGTDPDKIDPLPGSGSYRKYYRIFYGTKNVIGVINEDVSENEAFFSFTNHFRSSNLPVPEILSISTDKKNYLLEDLGDTTLFDLLSDQRKGVAFPAGLIPFYKKALEILPLFQIEAAKGIDYSKSYPRAAFDKQSMLWDLNYFKYYFLKLVKIHFDEQKLEDDFQKLVNLLLSAGQDYFLYRDFQSRNIMIDNDELYFIDYQGGRKGALQYDVASLLYDGKAAIPPKEREYLLDHYMQELDKHITYDHERFLKYYNGFVLIRIMQALGAYGFRGYYENKSHFLQSIPFAVKNLQYLLDKSLFPEGIPALRDVIEKITTNTSLVSGHVPEGNLHVEIKSFSFKKGLPPDLSGHGGGFVFDCRALPNPGRYEQYSSFNGRDKEVIDFLKKESSVDEFLNHVIAIVDQSIKEYLQRDFTNFSVSFGCTGGQHRSVYCAEKLAEHIKQLFNIKVTIDHIEKGNWKK